MSDNGWIKPANICCFIDLVDAPALNFPKETSSKVLGKGQKFTLGLVLQGQDKHSTARTLIFLLYH